MEGWISLHRKIRKNPIFNDHELLRLWLICLTEATHKERDQIIGRQTVHLLPGEFVTGRFDLEAMYNDGLKRDQQKSPKTVWRWLESLETGQYLTINSTNKFSVVAVLNWHIYQSNDHDIDQQVTNKRPTDDQQVTTNNNVNNKKPLKPSGPKRVYDEQSFEYRLANYLYTNILKFKPDLTEPNLQTWADDMRKLIEINKRDPKQIGQVIDWVTKDDFWQVNILSASKLRSKWDTVTARMNKSNFKSSNKQQPNLQVVQVTDQDRKELRDAFNKQLERNGVSPAVNI
jgi:hypothetical protein